MVVRVHGNGLVLSNFIAHRTSLQVNGEETDALTEDVFRRTAQTKTFRMSDGGYTAVMYAEPVHYQNELGEWEDIDNSLRSIALKKDAEKATMATTASVLDKIGAAVGLAETKPYLQNTNNSFKVSLPQEMSNENPVFVESDGHAIGFTLLEDTRVSAVDLTAENEQQELTRYEQKMAVATAEEQVELSMNEEMRLPNVTSEVKYAQVRPAVDVTYAVSGQSLKEAIIFNEMPRQASTFTYRMEYESLNPILQENGAVHFYEMTAGEGDEPVFIIQSPFMFDCMDDMSSDIAVTLTPTATGCLYTLQPDMAWLQDSARVYPVTLDPTVTTSKAAVDIEDNGVNAYNPTTNYITTNRMYVGSNYADGKGYESRVYIRFKNLPEIPSTAYIRYAALTLVHYSTASYQTADNNTFDIYDVGSNNWNTNTITWNTQKNYTFGSKITSFTSDKDDSDGKETAVITSLVQKWYKSSSNNGLVIKPRSVDNTKTNRTCYVSSDIGSDYTDSRPVITIYYYEGDPTPGIDSNAVYYIRNVSTGLYLQSGTEASDALTQNYYKSSRATKLQWRVTYLGGGCYNFVPQINTGLRLGVVSSDDVENRTVEVYTPTHSRGQTFRIYKNAGSLNSYRIQPLCSETRVISLATPYERNSTTKVQLRTWKTSRHEGRWIFTKTPATKKAKAFGGVFYLPKYGWDHEGERIVTRGLNQLGYDAVPYIEPDEQSYSDNMQKAEVVYALCHGHPEGLYFETFEYRCSPVNDGSDYTLIQELDLSNVKLMILYACNTAAADQSGDGKNICQVLQDMGADCVIGWEQILYVGDLDREWMKKFLQKMNAGKTVSTAVNELNDLYRENNDIKEAKMFGNGNLTL